MLHQLTDSVRMKIPVHSSGPEVCDKDGVEWLQMNNPPAEH